MPVYRFKNDGVWNKRMKVPMNSWRFKLLLDLLRVQKAVIDEIRFVGDGGDCVYHNACNGIRYTIPNPKRPCTWATDYNPVNLLQPCAHTGHDYGTIEVEFHFE